MSWVYKEYRMMQILYTVYLVYLRVKTVTEEGRNKTLRAE